MHRALCTLAITLSATSLLGADTGSFARGTKYAAPDAHAPANVSRTFVRTLTADEARNGVDLPATGEGGMIIWTLPVTKDSRLAADSRSTPLRSTLVTPAGSRLAAGDDRSADRSLERYRFDSSELGLDLPGGSQEVLHVDRTDAASYHVDFATPSNLAALTIVAAEPQSRLTLSTWAAPLSRMPGQPVTLHAELRQGDDLVTGAHVTARLAAPGATAGDAIPLFDDGEHDDGAADDGIYGAVVRDVAPDSGMWSVRFDADGINAHGVRFARTSSGGFMNERDAVRLGPPHAILDGEVLRITVPATVLAGGNYRFDVIVAGPENGSGERESLAWAESAVALERGPRQLSIDIPRSHLGDAKGLLLDLRLLGLDSIGVAGRATLTLE